MKLEMKQIERLLLVKVGICDGGSLFPLQITSLLALLRQLRQENLDLNNGGEEEEEGVEEWNVFAVDRKDVAISVCVFVSPLLRYSLGTFFLGQNQRHWVLGIFGDKIGGFCHLVHPFSSQGLWVHLFFMSSNTTIFKVEFFGILFLIWACVPSRY